MATPLFMKVAEQVAGEMNAWATKFFGKPIIADWRKQLSFTTKIFRARGLHLDDRQVRHAGGAGFSAADRRRHPLCRQQLQAADRVGRVAGVVPAENSDRRRGGVVERDPVGARRTFATAGGHHQGLRPGRTGGSQLPVDGDPRGAWAPLCRLQYRPVGLHQQRVRRDGVGSVVRQPEHRSDHDDLRLHAHVRRSGAPRRATRRIGKGSSHSGKAAWSRTFRSGRRKASRRA